MLRVPYDPNIAHQILNNTVEVIKRLQFIKEHSDHIPQLHSEENLKQEDTTAHQSLENNIGIMEEFKHFMTNHIQEQKTNEHINNGTN